MNKLLYKIELCLVKVIHIGYTPQEDNDEVDAYLITYIYDKITSIFYKHDRLIKS